jgi:hypothetical protein
MRRWVFRIAAAFSLATGLVAASLWIRSEFRCDAVMIPGETSLCWIESTRGNFYFRFEEDELQAKLIAKSKGRSIERFSASPGVISFSLLGAHRGIPSKEHDCHFTGFSYSQTSTGVANGLGTPRVRVRDLTVSYGWLLAISVAFPVYWAIKRCVMSRREAHGGCKCCGYDLRATPHRCPECGTAA